MINSASDDSQQSSFMSGLENEKWIDCATMLGCVTLVKESFSINFIFELNDSDNIQHYT